MKQTIRITGRGRPTRRRYLGGDTDYESTDQPAQQSSNRTRSKTKNQPVLHPDCQSLCDAGSNARRPESQSCDGAANNSAEGSINHAQSEAIDKWPRPPANA